jgi:hypothetical protein
MAKPVVRLGISIDSRTWDTLQKLDGFDGVRTYDFIVEGGYPSVWLCYVADSEECVRKVHTLIGENGGLPMKWAGEWRDSSEEYQNYFRAAVDVSRVENAVKALGGVPLSQSSFWNEKLNTAKHERDEARARFEEAFLRDTRRKAEADDFDAAGVQLGD